MVAAAVPAQPEPTAVVPAEPKKERDIVIVDVAHDGKTIDFTTSFTMTWKNPETGRVDQGTFTAKRPTLGTLGQIAVYKAKLNGGMQVDPQTDRYHQMMADLQFILTDVPDWWTPSEFFTADPLREVWDHVAAWCNSFRR